MSTVKETLGGAHFANSYNGAGTGLTGIPRSGIAAGTASQIVTNDGAGLLTSVAQITAAQGGTGLDTSALSGVAILTAGVWSAGTILNANVDAAAAIARSKLASGTASHVLINNGAGVMSSEAQLATTRGGTAGDSSAATGIAHVSVGSWSYSTIVDTDVSASAAIARSKLAAGTASQVVVNNGSGVMTSEAQLAVSRGGTGQNFSAIGVGLNVVTVTSGVFAASTVATTAATASTIVLRDGSGNIAVNGLTLTTLTVGTITTASGDLTINPVGDVQFGTNALLFAPTTVVGGSALQTHVNVQTTNATPTTLYTLATTSGGASGTTYHVRFEVALASVTGGSDTGTVSAQFKVKNIGGTVTVSTLVGAISILDGALTATAVDTSVSGANVLLRVTGIALTTINWIGRVQVLAQDF
jgi:hypothetical protein